MNAGKFFAGLSVLFFLVVSPLRGIARIIGRISLTSIPTIIGILGGSAAAVLAGTLISPLASRTGEIIAWGYSPSHVYWGVKGIAAVAAFFLFVWLSSFVTDFVLLFLRPDYPRPEGIHHDRYPMYLEDGGVIYHRIIFRSGWTALLLSPLTFTGVIALWRDLENYCEGIDSQVLVNIITLRNNDP